MWCSAPGRSAAFSAAIILSLLLAGCPSGEVLYDLDGDGSPDWEDCGPTDPSAYPGAEDRVDDAGVDNDCDGLDGVDGDGDGHASVESGGDDCNDDVAGVNPDEAEVPDDGLDNDCEGGDASCDADGDGVQAPACDGADCDDTNSLFFPGAEELCDGIDGNCDGVVVGQELDGDGDGVRGCEGDCDDSAAAVGPGQPEICDGLDDDCDAALPIDEVDGDGDGLAPCEGDCADDDPDRHPDAEEACNGLDDDCDGAAGPDEGDGDGDGDPACSDCDDGDPAIEELDADSDGVSTCDGDCDDDALEVHPGGVDAWGDGADGNCDGADGLDADADSWPVNGVPPDCDDDPASPDGAATWPGAPDVVGDEVDQDCDGVDGVDGDGDGLASLASGGIDCNDDPADPLAAVIFPGADDSVGNGIDSDCDGVDGVDSDSDSVASIGSGGADCDDAAPDTWPGAPDTAGDGVDQDCDGVDGVDDDGDGVASTASGGLDCNDDPTDPLAPTTLPGADDAVGNGIDSDCDGIDGIDGDGDGQPSVGSGGLDCNDDPDDPVAPDTWPGAPDVVDGADQDCDGVDGVDADGDGVASEASGGEDCLDDPANPDAASTFPGAGDVWGDGVDTSCDDIDGLDSDLDGWAGNAGDGEPDCNDGDDTIHPGATDGWESPVSGLDRDCDGEVHDVLSEAWSAWTGEAGSDGAALIANAGDVDGDGLDDLLIGAGGNDQAGDFAGKVYLVYGSTIAAGGSSSLAQADVALLGSAGDDAPGALASAGDVDGDGLDDILIGVPIPGDWGSSPGVTYLFFGASLPASGTLSLSAADAVIIGEVNGDGSGYAVASAGDVDGDGLDDILIGAPYHYLGGGMVGKAYLMFGSTIASGGTFWLSGADANFLEVTGWPDHTGKAVAGVGDVDGDGLDDVLISSPDNLNSTVTYGTAYLFFGSTIASGGSFALTGADAAMEGAGGYQSFGDPVASAGDVDGDGLADVVMSGSSGYLMFGATLVAGGTFVPADADASFPGGSGQMTSAGDVDGDGLDDVLVGATYAANGRGRAYLVLGATIGAGGVFDVELADAIFTGVETGDNAGSSLATVGDINGDSLSDLAIGAGGVDGYTGRTYVLLSAL